MIHGCGRLNLEVLVLLEGGWLHKLGLSNLWWKFQIIKYVEDIHENLCVYTCSHWNFAMFCIFLFICLGWAVTPLQVGLVIGKGGETIKNMQAQTGARIQVCFWLHAIYCSILVLYCSSVVTAIKIRQF